MQIAGVSGGWIGIVWIWNLIWFLPLDLIKFAMRAIILRVRSSQEVRRQRKVDRNTGIPITRTQSRVASIHESLYNPRTSWMTRTAQRVGLNRTPFNKKLNINKNECVIPDVNLRSLTLVHRRLKRFSSIQTAQAGAVLGRSASRS